MQEHIIPQDIIVMYVQADSFPQGVKAAYDKLHAKMAAGSHGRIFGISFPDKKGAIVYRASAELAQNDEAAASALETFTIRKGKYISELLPDWSAQESRIGMLFQQLLQQPGIDKAGYCLEEYINDQDVLLMVTLEQ